ncbi:phospholipase D2 isoform X1 [Acipenser ruthenus]|uniref:phospholipase D2 isoform X1 n=1 Tax=Acipenser ruthenus TaxID=7906 RepID=UPI0027409E70|nr:phospholipase D2 isoform X1 [Acipenser ruthenus]
MLGRQNHRRALLRCRGLVDETQRTECARLKTPEMYPAQRNQDSSAISTGQRDVYVIRMEGNANGRRRRRVNLDSAVAAADSGGGCSAMSAPPEGVLEETVVAVRVDGNLRPFQTDLPINCDELDCLGDATEERPLLIAYHLKDLRDSNVPPFLKGVPITCSVVNTERHTTRSKVRICTLYSVRLTHGEFSWTVKRKFKHFQELHRDLQTHRMFMSLLPR